MQHRRHLWRLWRGELVITLLWLVSVPSQSRCRVGAICELGEIIPTGINDVPRYTTQLTVDRDGEGIAGLEVHGSRRHMEDAVGVRYVPLDSHQKLAGEVQAALYVEIA